MGMAKAPRKIRGCFGIIASMSALFLGCSLDEEPYPGPPSGLECTVEGDPACIDDDPCTDNACSVYGECEHTKIPVGGACGPSKRAICNSLGVCVGCSPATATEDCGDDRFYCDSGKCARKATSGQLCLTGAACASNVCTGGVCE